MPTTVFHRRLGPRRYRLPTSLQGAYYLFKIPFVLVSSSWLTLTLPDPTDQDIVKFIEKTDSALFDCVSSQKSGDQERREEGFFNLVLLRPPHRVSQRYSSHTSFYLLRSIRS
jgi:hypothetical protein